MVVDSIKNAAEYYSLHPSFKAVFKELAALNEESEPGRIEVYGDSAYINLSSYTNKAVDECKFESHNVYIDIQYVIKGAENISVADATRLSVTEDRLENDDIAFFEAPVVSSEANLLAGDFVIIFPGEAHRPLAAIGEPCEMFKAVAKIKY